MNTTHTIDAIELIDVDGLRVPFSWLSAITYPSGKPNALAALLLADVVWWYKPKLTRNEDTGEITKSKRFSADKLQRSYSQWADQFSISKRIVKDAVADLVRAGVLTIEFRTVNTGNRNIPNIMFVEPVAEKVAEITVGQGHIYDDISSHMSRNMVTHIQSNSPLDIDNEKEKGMRDGVTMTDVGNMVVGNVALVYATECAALPKMRNLEKTTAGQSVMAAILKRTKEYDMTIDDWRKYFKRVAASPFLTGSNDRKWRADLQWLVKPANFAKVDQGNYDDRSAEPENEKRHGDLYV